MVHLLTLYSLRENSQDDSQQTIGDTLQARDFSDKITYAFQLAMQQGPLCNEPVQGVAVFLEEVTFTPSTDDETSARDKLGRLTGEVIKTVQASIKQGFLDWSPRLLLAMYSCEIQASSKLSSLQRITSSHIRNSRSPRSCLRRPYPPPWPHPFRGPQRRYSLFHHPLAPPCCRVLRLQR
jgi:hypothetical protein